MICYLLENRMSTLSPRCPAEQHQNGEDLQAADDHAQGQHDFGQAGKTGEVSAGADYIQTGAHVAHTGQSRAEGGGKGEIV